MIDAAKYCTLQFADKGRGDTVDCWGLVQRVYRDEFGITLPSYTEGYQTAADRAEIGAMIRREYGTDWDAVSLDEAHTGDVVLLRIAGVPMHVGVVLTPPHFLHALKGVNVAVERWDGLLWRQRVAGCYRMRRMKDRHAW
jgi:cell wall-associated NlpC family hydrolase